MVKKLFALASVTALTGLVSAFGAAGCSDDETPVETPPDSGTGDAKKDSKAPTPGDDDDDDDIPECYGGTGTYTPPPQYAYVKAAAAKPGSCTEQQLKDITKAVSDNTASREPIDFEEMIKPKISGDAGTCAECAEGTDEAWSIVNESSIFYTNGIGCLESKGKIPAACAKAVYDNTLCLVAVCNSCTSNAAQNECFAYAAQHDCKAVNEAAGTACEGLNVGELQTSEKCNKDIDIATQFCGGEAPDGG